MADLAGQTVLVTRSRAQTSQFVEKIHAAGGRTYVFPVIETIVPQDEEILQHGNAALQELSKYDWIFFTSDNGVEYFFSRLDTLRQDYTFAAKTKIVAVGPATAAALKRKGITSEPLPDVYQAEGLIDTYGEDLKQGEHVLLARGNLARSWLYEVLLEKGLYVTEAIMYDTVPAYKQDAALLQALKDGQIDVITFTSSSTVTYFIQALANMGVPNPIQAIDGIPIACIGPVTSQTAHEAGLNVTIVAKEATLDSLVEAISHGG